MLIKIAIAKTAAATIAIAAIYISTTSIGWWAGLLAAFAFFAVGRFLALHYYRWARDKQDLTTREGQIIKDRMNRNIDFLNGYYRRDTRAANKSR